MATLREEAEGALRAEQTDLERARKLANKTTGPCDEWDKKDGDIQRKLAAARADLANDPDDDNLATTVAKLTPKAQAVASKRQEVHAARLQAQAHVANAGARVEQAKKRVRVAELREAREARMAKLHDMGNTLGIAALELRKASANVGAEMQADAKDCAELVALGSACVPTDGLPFATGLGESFVVAGAGLSQVESATALRHAVADLGSVNGWNKDLAEALHAFSRPVAGAWPHRPDVEAELRDWRGRMTFGEVLAAREEQRQREFAEKHPHLAGTAEYKGLSAEQVAALLEVAGERAGGKGIVQVPDLSRARPVQSPINRDLTSAGGLPQGGSDPTRSLRGGR